MRWVAGWLVGGALLLSGAAAPREADEAQGPVGEEPEAKELSKEELAEAGKPILVLNAGGHTAAVARVLFTPDGKQVITVSHDKTVRLWDTGTGQTVRVLRLPVGPGVVGDLYAGALSPDGKTLAVAGWGHMENKERVIGIHLIALPEGKLRTLKGHTNSVECLAFSPDGKRLASGSKDHTARVWDLASGECVQTLKGHHAMVAALAFAPDGARLVTGSWDRTARIWSVATGKEVAVLEPHTGLVFAAGWSPDGKTIVTGGRDDKGLHVWNADGTPRGVLAVEGTRAVVEDVAFKGSGEVLVGWRTPHREGERVDVGASFVGLESGKWRPALPAQNCTTSSPVRVALSDDLRLGAMSGGDNHQTVVWTAEGKVLHRLADRGQLRLAAAWGTDKDSTAIAWGTPGRPNEPQATLTASFRFSDLTLSVGKPEEGKFKGAWHECEGLSVSQPNPRFLRVKEGNKVVAALRGTEPVECFTLLPGGKLALVRGGGQSMKFTIHLHDARTGEHLLNYRPARGRILALAPSPDGRYLLTASADQTVRVFAVEHSKPLVTLFVVNNEWVAWTVGGYYAASAGGERLMGWLVNHMPDSLGTFYEAAQFRKTLYRPDVLQRLLAAGSLSKALEQADQARGVTKSAVVDVEEVLPPKVTLSAPRIKGPKLTEPALEVEAEAVGGKQGVTSLQLLLDGRPYPGAQKSYTERKPGAAVKEKWTIQVPEGEHTLRGVARTEASLGISDDLEVVHAREAPRAKLYVLAVGINEYRDKNLKLACAVNDAVELAKTFQEHSRTLFDVECKVLTDARATKELLLKDGFGWLKASMKPRDLAVVFYAGHGEQDRRGFYLLPQDVNVKDLPGTAVSGNELKQQLADLPGKVLLLLDACHSGAIGRAISDIARDLADEDCGVIVLCAALGSEKAGEQAGHGFFCQAILEALQGRRQALRNARDGCVYEHHLEQYVIDRVQELSKDEQHPTAAKPTMRPVALARP